MSINDISELQFQSPSGDSLIWKLWLFLFQIIFEKFQSPSGDSLIWKSCRLFFFAVTHILFQSPSGDSLIWKF